MSELKIKKVVKNIYSIDYDKILLNDGDEFITESNGMSDFAQYLRKEDMSNNLLVSFVNYKNGLFYTTKNGGEIFGDPSLLPEVVNFGTDILGTAKGKWYRIKVIARSSGSNTIITDNRSLNVTDGTGALILNEDLTSATSDVESVGYFSSSSNETYLYFTIGKLAIKDIIIDEVEPEIEESDAEEVVDETGDGARQLVAYSIFSLNPVASSSFTGRYIQLSRIAGRGLDIYFDSKNNRYNIERAAGEDVLLESFTGASYSIEINLNKAPAADIYDHMTIYDVSSGISPNSLKQGYIIFQLLATSGKAVKYEKEGTVEIDIYKLK